MLDVDPQVVEIRAADGTVVDRREKPRESFPEFTSAATWNYPTAPYVFTYPGVEAHEIEPWCEDGETWRRLAVHFPRENANHNPDQVFYFDENFLQRRMDYSPEVTGAPPVAHYVHGPKEFGGFVFYTRRLIHVHGPDGVVNKNFVGITLDVDSVEVTRA